MLARWSLAYCGESTYVPELIKAVIAAPDCEVAKHFDAIRGLMLMLA